MLIARWKDFVPTFDENPQQQNLSWIYEKRNWSAADL